MSQSLATYLLDAATVTARGAEIAAGASQFAGGANEAGSCAPGIGVNTGGKDPKVPDWTTLDQNGAARTPQNSQHIGGDGTAAGGTATETLRCVQGADINDTVSFVVAEAVATDGQGMLAGNLGTVNRTGTTVQIGERVWGTDTVV